VMDPKLLVPGGTVHAPAGAGTARNVLANSEHRHGHLRRPGSPNSAPRNRRRLTH
jgi:hypothetical protein